MKTPLILLPLLTICLFSHAQEDTRITTLDFVQILNENTEEALYYYQNNWKELRKKAIEQGYIHSYELLQTPRSMGEPFDLILITTYANSSQYELREDNFGKLIEERGELRLMNEKKPGEFRRILFGKEQVRHVK